MCRRHCRGGETVTKENVTVRPNQKLNLGFDFVGEYDLDEQIPTVTTVIEAEDVYESGSHVQFVIEMGEQGASVSAIEVFDNLKPSEGGLAYSCDRATALTVTSLSGVNAFSGNVSGEGFIALAKGLYIYSFGSQTGKIFIR